MSDTSLPAEAIQAAAEEMPGLTREHAIQVATDVLEAAAPHIAAAQRERWAQLAEHEAARIDADPLTTGIRGVQREVALREFAAKLRDQP